MATTGALMALLCGRSILPGPATGAAVADQGHASVPYLEELRKTGDLRSQRRHVWMLIEQLTTHTPGSGDASFESWYGEDEVFGRVAAATVAKGIRGFSRGSSDLTLPGADPGVNFQSADAPVLTYTLYNFAAYDHIRRNRLNLRTQLERLRLTGAPAAAARGERSIPAFPRDAVVLKTVWWPIAADRATALPVWDPESNPPRRGGNDFTSWQRVIAVDSAAHAPRTRRIDFAGRSFPQARSVSLDSFHHILLDSNMAERVMRDPGARKSAQMTLGRALRAGDYLVLVAANLASREIADWIWAAFWWHDRPDQGSFAADRPAGLTGPSRNYLMQVAFDFGRPTAADGGPHSCFNPWLEGRFPDGGNGGGTSSNCMACHERASYPPSSFLPVTRGAPDLKGDPAYAPGRLRTSLLWSIALHSEP